MQQLLASICADWSTQQFHSRMQTRKLQQQKQQLEI